MSLTQIQQDAIARAKQGNFALLDAMELEHRLKENRDVCCGWLVGGRLRMFSLGYSSESVCFECDGEGDRDCHECDGDGQADCDDCRKEDAHQIQHAECGGGGCADCDKGKVDCPTCEATGTTKCDECNGHGTLECQDCDGSGSGYGDDEYEEQSVVNMDGTVLWNQGDDAPDPTHGCKLVDRSWARQVLADYQKEIDATAAIPRANPNSKPESSTCAQPY
jgi:hypothetical protein